MLKLVPYRSTWFTDVVRSQVNGARNVLYCIMVYARTQSVPTVRRYLSRTRAFKLNQYPSSDQLVGSRNPKRHNLLPLIVTSTHPPLSFTMLRAVLFAAVMVSAVSAKGSGSPKCPPEGFKPGHGGTKEAEQ